MFESLKKKLRSIFIGESVEKYGTVTPTARTENGRGPKSGRKKKKKSPPAGAAAPESGKTAATGRTQRRERSGRRRETVRETAAAEPGINDEIYETGREMEHPAELKPVPPCEGKTRFQELALHREVLFGVQQAGFEYCTPIQALALPPLLEHRDLAGKAQTGTGKTAAFLLASFTYLLDHPQEEMRPGTPRMLVLAPTRELAMQIHKDAVQLGVFTGLKCAVVFGGMDHDRQRRSLTAPIDVLIGTPGRVIDYSRGGDLNLSRVEILVIDEADRMLDMGFIPDVKRIVAQLPKKGERQTLFFSATLDESILRLTSGWLADPVVVESEPEHMVSDNIEQTFYSVLREEKLALLLYILTHETYDRIIIFGNRKDVNLRLQYDLSRYGYKIPVLSGDIAQEKRIKILERFREGREKVVIATDVAARGIHVDDVSIVINYDLPERAEDYIHRIGRTGRAGHTGKSISFLCEYGAYYLPEIEKLLDCRFSSALPTEEMLTLPAEVPEAALPRPESHHRSAGPGGHSAGRSGRRR